MTPDEANFQTENLAFFKSTFLDPGAARFEFDPMSLTPLPLRPTQTPIMNALCLIESALWLHLGTEIGFFDPERALLELGSIEDCLGSAWLTLRETESLSPQSWCDFMSEEPRPTVVREKFFGRQAQPVGMFEHLNEPQTLENVRQCFLGCLLLTSEVLFEPTMMIFLQRIGWDTDEKWKHLTLGLSMSSDFNLESLYLAFANHLQYLEEIPYLFTRHVFSKGYSNASITDVMVLYQRIFRIISERVIVDRGEAKERLFRLGSEVVAVAYQPGLEWQQLRRSVFTQIAGITEHDTEVLPKLWSDFVDDTKENLTRSKRERPLDSLEGTSFSTE
jgi:hypothetical protein